MEKMTKDELNELRELLYAPFKPLSGYVSAPEKEIDHDKFFADLEKCYNDAKNWGETWLAKRKLSEGKHNVPLIGESLEEHEKHCAGCAPDKPEEKK